MTLSLILAIVALLCAIIDAIRPVPYLLNVGLACLALALIL
jgi:hypothetical protein